MVVIVDTNEYQKITAKVRCQGCNIMQRGVLIKELLPKRPGVYSGYVTCGKEAIGSFIYDTNKYDTPWIKGKDWELMTLAIQKAVKQLKAA